MKLFRFNKGKSRRISRSFLVFTIIAVFCSCATRHVQYGSKDAAVNTDTLQKSPLLHTFYLVGDAGNADKDQAKAKLEVLKSRLGKAPAESTLLFLGDNIYPYGMPPAGDKERPVAQEKMDNQIALGKNFKGKTIFIPGNHDWYNGELKGLKLEEAYVNEKLKEKKSFMPKNGCAIEELKIGEKISLIVIDSQWYLENWDKSPTINDDCDIKTREDFFSALEDILNKNQNKTTIIAMHHPVMSSGVHGGQFSLKKQLFPFQDNLPLPVVASVINLIRKTSGIVDQDIQHKRYRELVKRIKALIQNENNVIVVSGHEHNLQYLEKDNIRQIVSGAGSKAEAARAIDSKDFSYGDNGYATLQVYDKGETVVAFYGIENNKEKLLFRHQVTPPKPVFVAKTYPSEFDREISASVYDSTLTKKNAFHNFFWGKHYRRYYIQSIKAQSVRLDTLYGGLKPILEGGGHQSISLRLSDQSGRPYVMRALKKSATRFLQSVAFKDQFIENEFKNTYAENFLLDFYTSSHPYTPFVVADLSDAVKINHSNPKLFYVPKQNPLGLYNENFGDELYMIEERPASGFEGLASFGKPGAILGTDEVLQNLTKDEKYKIDEKAYIRARIFDMLIGDWDRHFDQWRWGEFKEGGNVVYRPIPRDRDQAFPKYGGALLTLLMKMPPLRHMHSYKSEMGNVKWFNAEPYPLDLAMITASDGKVWQEQAQFIQEHLTDKAIAEAFLNLPKEVQDGTSQEIQQKLRSRRGHLQEYAAEYYRVLQKTVLIVGTDKKDKFVVTRLPKGQTEVKSFRLKKDAEELVASRIYDAKQTNELWIYGLDDDDVFEVKGSGSHPVRLRLLGGQNNDSYQVENGRKVSIYDFKTKPNQFKTDGKTVKVLSDDYNLNSYDYRKPKYNAIAGYPNAGYNPDDGVKVGISVTYTVNGFKRNPFSQKHNIRANYYFATDGYELIYKGIFPNILRNWQFNLDARITNPVFSFNFFGYGNETKNPDDELGMDYNRVRIQLMSVKPSMQWKGDSGAFFNAEANFESMEVDRTSDRIIATGIVNPDVFNTRNFAAVNLKYGFENYDNVSSPTLGMKFHLEAGYQIDLAKTTRNLPHLEAGLGLSYKLVPSGKLVAASQVKAKFLLSDDYEFYQMATIGGDLDVRGYRSERFSGKRSFFQSSDLRLEIGKIRRSLFPIKYGILGGFDYGRVWLPSETSDKWHTSYGGGFWLNGINVLTAKAGYFMSDEGGRFSFGLGFGF